MSIDGVVLAAGYSKRVGQFKPALLLDGKPILERCIENMQPVCDRIIVVGGYKIREIAGLIQHLPDITLVENKNFEDGMFSSVQCGIREVTGDRFFLIPGDQPVIKTETFQRLLDDLGDIVIPRYKGKKGHPALIAGRFIPEILAMPPTATLRDFIHSKENVIVDVDDPGIGLDVDTIEDLKKIERYIKGEMQ
ncbi:MAG: nucleotidyltransferase family protein [Candidatus Neomarinimicrobiota bacterium]|nr:MAG: nucleotidyltransferase family protein [Candidatus Neomarinimicrobiota bacterium]